MFCLILPDVVLEVILSFLPGYLRSDVSFRLSSRYRIKLSREYYDFGYIPYRCVPIIVTEGFVERSTCKLEDRIIYVPLQLWKPIKLNNIQRYLSFFTRPFMPRYVGTYRLSRIEYTTARPFPGFHLKFDVCKYPCEYICDFLMNWNIDNVQ